MRGLILYCRQDYNKNKDFVDWIRDEFKAFQTEMTLLLKEELYRTGIDFSQYSFAINRTRDYNLSLKLELNRIRVYNSSEVTLLGNNKLAGYAYAQKQGYAYAPVLLPSSVCLSSKVLAKPVNGHGGEGVRLIHSAQEWKADEIQQVLVEDVIGDIRFYIIQNQIHSAVLRKAEQGRVTSNYSQGGKIEKYHYNAEEATFVKRFIDGLKIDYAGLDFLLTRQGELIFNELEDVVGSRMLSKLGINDTIPFLVRNIVKEMKNRHIV